MGELVLSRRHADRGCSHGARDYASALAPPRTCRATLVVASAAAVKLLATPSLPRWRCCRCAAPQLWLAVRACDLHDISVSISYSSLLGVLMSRSMSLFVYCCWTCSM